ncbi:MAG TPA: PAS domain S-box protein [Hanamia sp.]|nr:PAS domain S-box protein [Hanamia sp.]
MNPEMSETHTIPEIHHPTHHARISLNLEGVITNWNNTAERIFGYSPNEIIGKNISILFEKEFIGRENEVIKNINHGSIQHYETECKTKAGKKICILFSCYPVKDAEENVTGVSVVGEDISEQKEAEEKQAILSAIVSSSDDAIICKTLKGIITSWNEGATKIFGYTAKEVIGKHISIIIPKSRLSEEDLIIATIKKGEKIDHFETVRIAKDGTERNISLTITPLKNKKGEIIGASKVAKDISFKKQTDERQATLAAIVSSSDDAIISKTLDGIITSWNAAATKMFGYLAEEAVGKHISIIIPAERIGEETRIIESIRNGEKIDHFETVRIAKDGSKRNLSITVSPIKTSDGKIIGASKIARDISLRKEAEEQRRIYTERLLELNNYKDEFMVMASHELKTPLTVILGNLQILESMMEEDPRSEFIEKTIKQVNKLSALITTLLDVSKIQAGKLQLNPTRFDMNDLVSEIANNLQQTSKDHQIIFNIQDEKLMVNADRERIEQVLINLLSNAIKYSPDDEQITIHAGKKDGNIIVSIHDNGIGIPQKDIENVFLRFYRVSGSASSFSGSGVGLYISSEIIKSHHGNIWAKSKIGKGSDFYFSIPAGENKITE